MGGFSGEGEGEWEGDWEDEKVRWDPGESGVGDEMDRETERGSGGDSWVTYKHQHAGITHAVGDDLDLLREQLVGFVGRVDGLVALLGPVVGFEPFEDKVGFVDGGGWGG